jgi:hypothetical protein
MCPEQTVTYVSERSNKGEYQPTRWPSPAVLSCPVGRGRYPAVGIRRASLQDPLPGKKRVRDCTTAASHGANRATFVNT